MAVFSINTDCLNSADYSSAEDIKKVKSYLYRLNDQLQYMFSNLTTEDNLSAEAAEEYATTVATVSNLEQTVKGKASEASIEVLEGQITLEVSRAETAESSLSSRITQNADNITLEVSRAETAESSLSSRITQNADNITLKVNSSDLGNSSLTIKPAAIELSTTGQLTIDSGNLTIDSSGNATFSGALSAATGTFAGNLSAAGGTFTGALSAASGTFTGTVSAGTITGSTITGGTISGGTISGETISGGTISGSTISSSAISGSSMTITSGSSINIESGGAINIKAGSTFAVYSENFTVTQNGDVYISGTFGAFEASNGLISLLPEDEPLLGSAEGIIKVGSSGVYPGATITYGTIIRSGSISTGDIGLYFSSGIDSVVDRIEALESRVSALEA